MARAIKLVNRTPHPIKIQTVDGEIVEIPPTPPPIRLEEQIVGEEVWDIELPDGRAVQVKVVVKTFTGNVRATVTESNTVLDIVSLPVAMMVEGAPAPDTGEGAVRDEKGNILYVTRLCVVQK